MKSSARVLSSEPDLLILPILAMAGTAAAVAAIYFGIVEPLGLHGIFDDKEATGPESELLKAEHLLVLFLLYLSMSFVATFFSVALASAALSRLRGGGGGVGSGLACAAGKAVPILGYAALYAVLGLVRRFLNQSGGTAGRVGSGVVGIAARLVTFLVVPVIAAEQVGPLSAIRRSASLLRTTWGENIIGGGGLSFVFVLLLLALATIGGSAALLVFAEDGFGTLAIAASAVVGFAFGCLVVTWSALAGIYKAALYAYAVDGSVPQGYAPEQIEHAFRQKGAAASATS